MNGCNDEWNDMVEIGVQWVGQRKLILTQRTRRRAHFMSSAEGDGDATCPTHKGFLQALVYLQSVCSTNYGYRRMPSKQNQCACSLHRILIQVLEGKWTICVWLSWWNEYPVIIPFFSIHDATKSIMSRVIIWLAPPSAIQLCETATSNTRRDPNGTQKSLHVSFVTLLFVSYVFDIETWHSAAAGASIKLWYVWSMTIFGCYSECRTANGILKKKCVSINSVLQLMNFYLIT